MYVRFFFRWCYVVLVPVTTLSLLVVHGVRDRRGRDETRARLERIEAALSRLDERALDGIASLRTGMYAVSQGTLALLKAQNVTPVVPVSTNQPVTVHSSVYVVSVPPPVKMRKDPKGNAYLEILDDEGSAEIYTQ